MSSANPKGPEPSMEEILASIRRIISDDQDGFSPARPAVDLYAVEAEQDDLPDPSAETSSLDPSDDDVAAEPVEPAHPAEADPGPEPDGSSDGSSLSKTDRPLLSEAVSASIAGAFDRLEAHGAVGGAPSFEETVKEMMRPMLKAWLDQNLPGIVERLVQAEIERVTRP